MGDFVCVICKPENLQIAQTFLLLMIVFAIIGKK